MAIYVSKAHLHAFVDRDIYVVLPPEAAEPGMCAKLVRSLHGTRCAPARWGSAVHPDLAGLGVEAGKASACCFWHTSRGVRCVAHGNDFTFTGCDEDLDWAHEGMGKAFLCKVVGRLGNGPGDVQELRLLNRVVRWTPQGL